MSEFTTVFPLVIGSGTSNTNTFTNLTVTGTLTVEELHMSTFTSSIMFSSGSTRFGDTLDDIHGFTGSVYITGSLFVNNTDISKIKTSYSASNIYNDSSITGSTVKSALDFISSSIQVFTQNSGGLVPPPLTLTGNRKLTDIGWSLPDQGFNPYPADGGNSIIPDEVNGTYIALKNGEAYCSSGSLNANDKLAKGISVSEDPSEPDIYTLAFTGYNVSLINGYSNETDMLGNPFIVGCQAPNMGAYASFLIIQARSF